MVAGLLTTGGSAGAAPERWVDTDRDGFGVGSWVRAPGAGGAVTIPAGGHVGASGFLPVDQSADEAWFRYHLRFEPGFRVDAPSRGKLPGPTSSGLAACSGGADPRSAGCWSARMLFSPVYTNDGPLPDRPYDPAKVTRLGYYVYHQDSPTGRGDHLLWDRNVGTLDHGRWYCIEGQLSLNTPGSRNGTLVGWVDGQEAFRAPSIAFRGPGGGQGLGAFWYHVYYGGSVPSPVTNRLAVTSVAVAGERIGCADGGGGFIDVSPTHTFEADIVRLASAGITRGCNPPANTRFCPEGAVTRGQMAAFLTRALDLPPPPVVPEPDPGPGWWGLRSIRPYLEGMDALLVADQGPGTWGLSYPIEAAFPGGLRWTDTGSSAPSSWVPIQLGRIAERGITPFVNLTTTDLPGLASGAHDTHLDRIGAAIRAHLDAHPGSHVLLAPLGGANRDHAAWGGDPIRFRSAWERIAARVGHERLLLVLEAHTVARAPGVAIPPTERSGISRWWPTTTPDVVALMAVDTAGIGATSLHGAAIGDVVGVAGPGMPIILTRASAPAIGAYVASVIELIGAHPQVMGVVWEDGAAVTTPSGTLTSAMAGTTVLGGYPGWPGTPERAGWSSARAANAASSFSDVGPTHTFRGDVAALAAAGITRGCNPPANTRFCPDAPVTRGQMAAFLNRAGLSDP